MPLVVGFFLVAFFIWIAENVATFGNVWLYPTQQNAWHLVSVQKILAWYLLMLISFVLVSLVNRPRLYVVIDDPPAVESALEAHQRT